LKIMRTAILALATVGLAASTGIEEINMVGFM